MNETAPGPAAATTSRVAPPFGNLRRHLTHLQGSAAVLDELASASTELEQAGAKHAAERLLQLDTYASVLTPEALPQLVDMDRALDELEEATSKGLARWVLLRNIFALFPLLMTWFSLSVATSVYHDEVLQHPNQVYQPFLVLWENGFDHRIWLTFSLVATIDSILFFSLICMTGAIHWLEHQSRSRAHQLAARVDRSVTALAGALGEVRWRVTNNPGDFATEVRRVIERALEETRELNKANQQALETVRLTIHEARQSHTQLMHDLGAELATTLEAVRAESARLLQQTAQELHEMLAQAFATQNQVAAESLAAVTEARRVGEQSNERAQMAFSALKQAAVEELHNLHETDRQFLVGIGSETRDLLQGLRSELALYRQSASTLASSIGQIGDAAATLGANAEVFVGTAKAMAEHVQSAAQSQERFASKLEDAAAATHGAADHMNRAAEQMQASLAQVHGVLEALSGRLVPQLQSMGAQVQHASEAMAETQDRLADTSKGLARAAEYFRDMPRPKVVLALIGRSSN
jgi:hypothetical protein